MAKVCLKNGKIVLPDRIADGSILLSDGVIENIMPSGSDAKEAKAIDLQGKYVLPGFVDIHTNGIAGFDLTNGMYDIATDHFSHKPDEYIRGLKRAMSAYVESGVTTAVLTSIAAPLHQLRTVFSLVRQFKENAATDELASVFGGLYVEGTFIHSTANRGGHNPDYFYVPSVELFEDLQKAAGGHVTVVNVPPESGEPALKLIEHLRSTGVVAAIGHTGATGEECERAFERGVTLAVHLLNGPNYTSGKSIYHGGAIEAILRNDDISVEVILDGYHVDRSYVRDIIARKTGDRVLGITDSMFAAALQNLKEFEICGVRGAVSANGEYMQIADRPRTLLGSRLTMDVAFSNLISLLSTDVTGVWTREHKALSLDEAIVQASRMLSGNPARVMGIVAAKEGDIAARGCIAEGRAADLVVADIMKNMDSYRLKIDSVYKNGIQVVNG